MRKFSMDNSFDRDFNDWMTRLNKAESPGQEIVAFNYGLFETTEGYTIYLIGAKLFDETNEEWACDVDFQPKEKYLPINPNWTRGLKWHQMLDKAVDTISKYMRSKDFEVSILRNAKAVTTGFDDGNLTRIK